MSKIELELKYENGDMLYTIEEVNPRRGKDIGEYKKIYAPIKEMVEIIETKINIKKHRNGISSISYSYTVMTKSGHYYSRNSNMLFDTLIQAEEYCRKINS